jgi:PAS domain S-box-containing protein
MVFTRKNMIAMAVGLTILSAIFAAKLSFDSIRTTDLVEHTLNVQRTGMRVLLALVDAETGQRGFLLTNDPAYLEPYSRAAATVKKTTDDLRALTVDNAEQQSRIAEVTGLIASKMDELDATLKLARDGKQAEANALVRTNAGKAAMDAIRQHFIELTHVEDNLLQTRTAERNRARDARTWMIFLTLFGALAIAATMSQAFRSHIAELKATNAELDQRVAARTADLKAEEMRQRLALDAGQLGAWQLASDGKSSVRAPRHDEIFGYPEPLADWSIDDFFEHVHDADRVAVRRLFEDSQKTGSSWVFECRIIRANDNAIRWIEARGSPRYSAAGKPEGYVGVVGDVTDRVTREQRLKIISQELEHRSKNLLAVIQSISNQTARHSTTIDEYRDGLSQRILGLLRSQDILVGRQGHGAGLKSLVTSQLKTFGNADQHIIDGPEVILKSNAAQSIGLALHELATNAAKYGALSVPAGAVEVTWTLDDDHVNLTWRERGGPPVVEPARKGFGSSVLRVIAAQGVGGETRLDYRPEGVVWTAKISNDLLA